MPRFFVHRAVRKLHKGSLVKNQALAKYHGKQIIPLKPFNTKKIRTFNNILKYVGHVASVYCTVSILLVPKYTEPVALLKKKNVKQFKLRVFAASTKAHLLIMSATMLSSTHMIQSFVN